MAIIVWEEWPSQIEYIRDLTGFHGDEYVHKWQIPCSGRNKRLLGLAFLKM